MQVQPIDTSRLKKKTRASFRLGSALALPFAIEQPPGASMVIITVLCFQLCVRREWDFPAAADAYYADAPLQGVLVTTPAPDDEDPDEKIHVEFPAFGINYTVDKKFISQVSPGLNADSLLSAFMITGGGPKEIGRIEMKQGALIIQAKVDAPADDSSDSVLDAEEIPYGGTE